MRRIIALAACICGYFVGMQLLGLALGMDWWRSLLVMG